MEDAKTLPHNVKINLNIGGVHLHTSLHTVMEGARLGCNYFQILCLNILQEAQENRTEFVWNQTLVPTEMAQYEVEHFIDADPTAFQYWIRYFRMRTADSKRLVENGKRPAPINHVRGLKSTMGSLLRLCRKKSNSRKKCGKNSKWIGCLAIATSKPVIATLNQLGRCLMWRQGPFGNTLSSKVRTQG
jgi:hypothetical protein